MIEIMYRGTSKTDANCDELRRILREIDRDFDIDFNYDNESYSIYHKGFLFRTVPYDAMNANELFDIRRVVWTNINKDIFKEIDEANTAADKRKEKARMEISENLASELRKPLLKELRGA